MESDTIDTARLHLRRFRPEDAPALHIVMSDPEAMRFWSTLPHSHLDQTAAWISRTIATVNAGEGDDFAVLRAGRLVGKCGLWNATEIGILFARETWGTGLAREAAEAIIARARARGVPAITADVDPRNVRALGFLRWLSFVKTGEALHTFRLGDEWADSVYLTLVL